ncbi:HAD-IA family hydrolase [Arthrobacter psychrolactophilus]
MTQPHISPELESGPEPELQLQQFTVSGLLFDLDGTLIDSTPATERAWRTWGELMVLENFHYGTHGVPAQALVEQTIEPARQLEAFELIMQLETADTDGVLAKDGALELLGTLTNASWTIVTSCTQGLADARMAAAGVSGPPHMVTADQITHGKPHPEPFLLGASRLGVAIGDCLVIEDAPAGLTSGRAAGALTLAIAGTTTASELDADYVVNSLADVSAEILSDGRIRMTVRTA